MLLSVFSPVLMAQDTTNPVPQNDEEGIDSVLKELCNVPVSETELNKVKNKVESTMEFSEMDLAGRALNLAIAEYMGDINLINTELKLYRAVTAEDIKKVACEIFRKSNCSTLYYLSAKSNSQLKLEENKIEA